MIMFVIQIKERRRMSGKQDEDAAAASSLFISRMHDGLCMKSSARKDCESGGAGPES
jgi:hypothetical protein